MKRKFTNIVCIYHDDKNYIPARFNCPDLVIDDVVINMTTNAEDNYNKTAELIVDYAFALFCNKSNLSDFQENVAKYKRSNWKLLDFTDSTNTLIKPKVENIVTSAGPSQVEKQSDAPKKATK